MNIHRNPCLPNQCLRQVGRGCTAAALCLLLAGQPLLAAVAGNAKPVAKAEEDQGNERILQALNRLTFGPRPGDLEAVKAMGLDKWIDQQLNPSSIDDSALDARLAQFPAMRMKVSDLLRKFPSNQQIKQVSEGKGSIPSDPEERAIYVNDLARYKENQAKQAALAQGGQAQAGQVAGVSSPASKNEAPHAMPRAMGGAVMDAAASEAGKARKAAPVDVAQADLADAAKPDMRTHEEKLYADLEATEVVNLAPDKRMQRLIAMPPSELQTFVKDLPPEERQALVRDMTPQQRETVIALANPRQVVVGELTQSKLIRSIYSDRQLQEVMTDFWLNHFNIYIRKGQLAPYYLVGYERDVIRPRALGKFEDLLVATAKSPAMLFYLDNFTSIGPDSLPATRARKFAEFNNNAKAKGAADRGLNENYGRELMELHTLGVNGGYTQQDVTQAAKVFTGWTLDRPYQGGGGAFSFEANRHEPGTKVVLGHQFAESGENEGLELLHMLANNPATAHFVSSEIAVRFVSDTPPPALVDRMAQSWLASGGDIRTVLKTMISSPEFWSKSVYRAKFKTPLEYVVSAARASGTDVQNAQPLVGALDRLGMPLYGCQPPTGYSNTADAWVSTGALVNRMNFSISLAENRLPGSRIDWTRELGSVPTQVASLQSEGKGSTGAQTPVPDPAAQMTPEQREARLEALLLGDPASEKTRETVLGQFKSTEVQQAATKSFPITLSEGIPMAPAVAPPANFRPMTPQDRDSASMAGLLLGSPEFQRR